MKIKEFSTEVNGKTLTIKMSDIANQTNCSLIAQMGETTILVTTVMGKQDKVDYDSTPLSVDYEEKYYATGKIYGSRFLRRESRPTDIATLTSRMIDRTIRPLFDPLLRREIQVSATCLSVDEENSPDIVGMIGASAALLLSDIPWSGPIAGVRIGYKNGSLVINPGLEKRDENLDFEMVLAGIKNKINMIEFQGEETDEALIKQAFQTGQEIINKLCDFLQQLQAQIGKEKAALTFIEIDKDFKDLVKTSLKEALRKIFLNGDLSKQEKNEQKQEKIKSFFEEHESNEELKDKFSTFGLIMEEIENELLHEEVLNNDRRPDGRKLDEIRNLDILIDILPRTHGSALFVRGQTQTLSVVTLGAPTDTLLTQGMEFTGEKRYIHHYNFPKWSVGELGRSRGPGRREIGHGALAEKGLLPVVPGKDVFPYTIRVVSEVLASNGSSSMASTCSSCLALMAAGVPIKRPVAGIAMGVIIDETNDQNYKILTDIQGPEDHYGDMDFKVSGTEAGVNALQLDVKVSGIDAVLLDKALVKAKEARLFILEKIKQSIQSPRETVSKYAPKIITFKVNPEKVGEIIGSGGKTINKIIDETGVAIDIDEDSVFITGVDLEMVEKAKKIIENIIKEYEIGDVIEGTVVDIKDFGAIVEFDGRHSGLLHISELDHKRIDKVTDIVKMGDKLQLKIKRIEGGKTSLSLKDMKK